MIASTLLAALLLSPGPDARTPSLERVAVIGASVSDGFLLPLETGCMVTLADFLLAAADPPPPAPFRRTSALFFLDPERYGRAYVDAAQRRDPTLVVAVDFLFWYGYGFVPNEEARLARLERGLAQIERFSCPVLIGDFPDFHRAAVEGVGLHGRPMIVPAQVPAPETLARLNARVREFARVHAHVHVVPLADVHARIERGEAVEVRGRRFGGADSAALLDDDLLHMTLAGEIALTLLLLDTFVREDGTVAPDRFVWDPDRVRARLLAAHARERSERGARAR